MRKFKIGDGVKINIDENERIWYSNELYVVKKVEIDNKYTSNNEQILYFDKLLINGMSGIHSSYIHLDLNELRKKKLKILIYD